MSNRKEHIINLVKNQTDYDEETIKQKLKEHNGNYIFVIKEYLNPEFNKNKKNKNDNDPISVNQKIMKGYRNFLDTAYLQYEKRKEIQAKIENYVEEQKKLNVENAKVNKDNEDNEIVNKD